ncbi:SLCO4C1 [Cervus elaphus hippelaphus]|uniref:SLCO4C1 n=1 Tax=Cervus elaphus hippelaphus TaxID=46360 RepID=A0A212D0V5_CEREH|nr:SLCO4C1 [Cervus elaphus hippelaphus]
MKSCKGIENPAFVASSPENPRRLCASSPCIEISVVSTPDAGSPPPQEPPERPESPQPSGAPDASRLGSLSEYEEGPYGLGSFQPRALQRCNTPRGFLFHYCLLALTQGIVVNGLVNISISTIEKRYELQSSLTGLISSSYDIAFCLLSLFVSFFGERGHKPRWLAFSSFMIGLGALVFSLPKFFSGKYQFGSLFKGVQPSTDRSERVEKQPCVLDQALLQFLVCPLSSKPLSEAWTNELMNEELGRAYPIPGAVPNMDCCTRPVGRKTPPGLRQDQQPVLLQSAVADCRVCLCVLPPLDLDRYYPLLA